MEQRAFSEVMIPACGMAKHPDEDGIRPTATIFMKQPVKAAHFGDGDGLLFHDLMDGCAVCVSHLVKLIDAADALISQHQGSPFQGHFSSQRISHHGSS